MVSGPANIVTKYAPFAGITKTADIIKALVNSDIPSVCRNDGPHRRQMMLKPRKFVCRCCKALMYDEERSNRYEPDAPPIFKICCGDGKYLLPPTPYPDLENRRSVWFMTIRAFYIIHECFAATVRDEVHRLCRNLEYQSLLMLQ